MGNCQTGGGGLGQFADLRDGGGGGLVKKRGGGDTPMHTMLSLLQP